MKTFKAFINETTFTGGGNVRGLGQTTGESPNSEDDILYYLNVNIQDADTRDNQLKALIKAMHFDHHKQASK